MDRAAELREIIGKKIGIRQADHCSPGGLRKSAAVREICVGKMRVPVDIIINRVVDAPAILAAVAKVERGDAKVIDEDRIIGAGAEGSDAQIGAGS